LKSGGYFLLIARMEPENNIEMIIKAWLTAGKRKPLVLVGDAGNGFGSYLRKIYRDEKLLFAGPDLRDRDAQRAYGIIHRCTCTVIPLAEPTHPCWKRWLAAVRSRHTIIFLIRSSLGNEACYFSSKEDLAALMGWPPDGDLTNGWKQLNTEKILTRYSWDNVIDRYLRLFMENVPV
jgi:hypothetical protein